jgi:hypothetical protein
MAAQRLVRASTAVAELEPAVVALVLASFVSDWECLPQIPDDRSPSAAVPSCLSLTGT